jgi:hypothetical protein
MLSMFVEIGGIAVAVGVLGFGIYLLATSQRTRKRRVRSKRHHRARVELREAANRRHAARADGPTRPD